MARRTKEEAEKTRNSILDAAELVFYKLGFVRTSLQNVAEEAGVTRGAVYWHFKNKIDLLNAVINRVVSPHAKHLGELVSSNSPSLLQDLCSAIKMNMAQIFKDDGRRRVFTIMFQRSEYTEEEMLLLERRREVKKNMADGFCAVLANAKSKKLLAPFWTPDVAAVALHALLIGLIMNGLEQKNIEEFSELAEKSIESFFYTLSYKEQ